MGAAPSRTNAFKRTQTVLAGLSIAGLVALFAAAAAAAPSAIGAQTATSTNTSITVPRPDGVVAGDVLVGTVTSRVGAAVTISVPSGWSFVRRDTCTLPGTQMTQALYYRVASSDEPASTSWTLSRNPSGSAAIAAYRGIDADAPLMAHSGSIARDSRTATAPSIEISEPETLLVGSFGRSTSTSVTAPADTTPRYSVASAGRYPASIFGLDTVRADAGATGPVATDAAEASGCAIGQLLALRTAAGGGGESGTTAPSVPSSLQATGATASSIELAWDASSDDVGVAGYGLYRDGAAVGSSGSTSASFSGLECERNYTLGVDAFDGAGNRSATATITASTGACEQEPPPADREAPSVPSSLQATGATASSIELAWDASSDNVGVTGYGLYRDRAAAGSSGSPSASFSGLECGRSYTLGVDAYDGAGNRSAAAAITAATRACEPPPPPGAGTTLTYTDTFWRCTRPIRDYAVNGLPLRVIMQYTRNYVPPTGAGAVQLGAGCVGDGTAATDLILDIRGDGRTHGPGDDAIRVMNARPGASNLQVEGRADCGGRVGSAHQDGIQVLGGTNITFRNFEIGDYDAGRSTCQGAGGAFFYSLGSINTRVEGGKYIACNHSLFAGTAGGHVSGAMFRSGRTDGTDPVCVGYAASNPCMGPQLGLSITVSGLTCQSWNRTHDRWEAR